MHLGHHRGSLRDAKVSSQLGLLGQVDGGDGHPPGGKFVGGLFDVWQDGLAVWAVGTGVEPHERRAVGLQDGAAVSPSPLVLVLLSLVVVVVGCFRHRCW